MPVDREMLTLLLDCPSYSAQERVDTVEDRLWLIEALVLRTRVFRVTPPNGIPCTFDILGKHYDH